jgi:YbgC/YbaW family acyl-CoA thioester hydrolase
MPSPYVTRERVRWADVDLVGIMRYSAFTRLIEHADQEMFRAAGMPYSASMDHPTYWIPRKKLTIEYHAPVTIDVELAIVSYITHMGDTSLSLAFDVRRNDTWSLVASAILVVVCVTADTFVKCSIPDVVRNGLAAFQCSPDVGRNWVPTAEHGSISP